MGVSPSDQKNRSAQQKDPMRKGKVTKKEGADALFEAQFFLKATIHLDRRYGQSLHPLPIETSSTWGGCW